MLNNIKKVKIAPIVLALMFLVTPARAMEDAIIAIVNDELITLRDLREFIRSNYLDMVSRGMKEEDMKRIMLDLEINGINRLIEEKLLLSKANELGLIINDKLIDERLEEIKAKYPSEEVFLDSLIKNGATMTDLRNKIVSQLKIKYAIDYEVRSKIYINPQEVTQYYEDNIEQFQKKERVSLESIFIPFSDSKSAARALAKEAHQKLEDGANFDSVREKYSKLPSVGVVERGQLQKEVEDVVFKLRIDKYSAPIEVDNGLFIFLLTGRMPSVTANLLEVKQSIRNLLFNKKFNKELRTWIEKLKEDAYIEIKE